MWLEGEFPVPFALLFPVSAVFSSWGSLHRKSAQPPVHMEAKSACSPGRNKVPVPAGYASVWDPGCGRSVFQGSSGLHSFWGSVFSEKILLQGSNFHPVLCNNLRPAAPPRLSETPPPLRAASKSLPCAQPFWHWSLAPSQEEDACGCGFSYIHPPDSCCPGHSGSRTL